MDIKRILIKRLCDYCYINDIGMTGYPLVLQNIVHENDIQYILAEKYYEEHKEEIIKEMINYERKGKIETSDKRSV